MEENKKEQNGTEKTSEGLNNDTINTQENRGEELVYDAGELKKGKRNLWIIIGIAILYRLLFFVSYFSMPGDNPDASILVIPAIVGFFLTIFIFNYLYIGRKWAKIVACIQLSVGILSSLSSLFSNPYYNGMIVFDLFVNIIILLVLLFNKNVLSFLDYQKNVEKKIPVRVETLDK